MQHILHNIAKPTALVDEAKLSKNITRMFLKAHQNGIVFRPHFKSHQSLQIADWFRKLGIRTITVSNLDMAEYFANNGWNNITVAIPVNVRDADHINNLASFVKLNLVVSNLEAISMLEQKLNENIGLFIKVDAGYGRTGVPIEDHDKLKELKLVADQAKLINFKGFLLHSGESYDCKNEEEILAIHENARKKVEELKKVFPNSFISIGDTPTCSVADDFSWVNEMRPGNFVFYDLMQFYIGSCELSEISLIMACPIIAKHADRKEVIIHGGAVHFSKESIQHEKYGTCYGEAVSMNGNSWNSDIIEDVYLSKLSQEHGTLKVSDEYFASHEVGDLVYIIPVHSCLCINLMKRIMTTVGHPIETLALNYN